MGGDETAERMLIRRRQQRIHRLMTFAIADLMAIIVRRCGLLVAALLIAAPGFYLTTALHHDVSWYLVATSRLLDGARLYVDIIEVNPPLAFYLTMPPVAAARLIGISGEAGFIAYTLVLIGVSLFLVQRLLDSQPGLSPAYRCIMLLASATALIFAPIGVFGQREHLMLAFALPYLFLLPIRLASYRKPPFAVLIGILAAVGFCLKPHFFLVPAALELCFAVRQRSPFAVLRAETWSLFAGSVLYALFVVLVHPEYLAFIVPNATLVYDAYSRSLGNVVFQISVLAILPALILYALARSSGIAGRTADSFAIATIGFLAVYVIQSKGWTYHLLPAITAGSLTAAAIIAEVLSERPSTKAGRLLAIIGGGAMAIPLIMLLANGAYHNRFSERLLPEIEKYAANGAIFSFTSHVWVSFPLVNEADVQWASRFPTQWLLPGALRRLARPATLDRDTERRLRQIERYAIDAVIEDLERMPPDLVIVDKRNPYFGTLDFDFLAYFSREPRFVALWRPYVKIKDVIFTVGAQPRNFEIWCRRNSNHSCAGPNDDARSPAPNRFLGTGISSVDWTRASRAKLWEKMRIPNAL